jgi:polyhydroxyalkanoate synthesis regulator phasin
MSRPIKISDELYERLKGQAEADGLTLQDALVELITTPHEGLNALQREFDASRRALASQQESQHTQQAALEKLRSDVASLRERVKALTELRGRDVKAFNDWVATWKRIDPLEEDLGALASRVSALENVSHRHIGQRTREET